VNVGSLFTGIGGFDLGLERAGMRIAWQCESDEFCRRVLTRHWPGVPCFPDIKTLRADAVEPVEVLCGGFPCQDISLAGRGSGIDGTRSGLWAEYARLVRELRPRYVVVENVAALLARGMGRVLGDLAACGYDAEWDCLPASAFGAPHRRDRIWLVAYPSSARRRQDTGSTPRDESANARWAKAHDHESCCDGEGRGAAHVADSKGGLWWPGLRSDESGARRRCEPADCGQSGGTGELQDADGGALESWRVGGRAAQAGGPEWWAVEPPVGRVAHGVPGRLDQLAALGNALVPQIAEWIGRRLMCA